MFKLLLLLFSMPIFGMNNSFIASQHQSLDEDITSASELLYIGNSAHLNPQGGLVPVDTSNTADPFGIDTPKSNWKTLSPLAAPTKWDYWQEDYRIRSRHLYDTPGVSNSTKPIIGLIVHGSRVGDLFHSAGPYNLNYHSVYDSRNQVYRDIMNFFSTVANSKAKKVEVLSVRWPGTNLAWTRQWTALFLHDYLKQNYPNHKIIYLSHSHGCNVGNYLSNLLNKPISLMVFFACPFRKVKEEDDGEDKSLLPAAVHSPLATGFDKLKKINEFSPDKFKKLIYFFSKADWVAAGGSVDKYSLGASIVTPIITHYAIDAALSSQTMGLSKLANKFPKTTTYAKNTFKAAVAAKSTSNVYDSVSNANTFSWKHKDRTIIGVRFQHQTKDPTHGGLVQAVAVLPQVLDAMSNKYPHHTILNSTFDLHTDGNTSREMVRDLILAIRQRGSSDRLLELPANVRSQIDSNSLKAEENISKQERAKFKSKYNRELSNGESDSYDPRNHCNQM
ncbi:hypothetical protein M1446_02705 [Candidatus Dependentiae bacterium]|nr:hypothetical protein [Candidatus Dependentiae bacterium]